MRETKSVRSELEGCSPEGNSVERRYPGLEEATLLFKAVGDETRLSILRQLQEKREVCACDFLACCDLAQPTVSHDLKVLREAGLVSAEKRGLWVYYTLNADKVRALKHWLAWLFAGSYIDNYQ